MGAFENFDGAKLRRGGLLAGLIGALVLPLGVTAGEHDFGVTAAVHGDVQLGGAGNVNSGARIVPGSDVVTGANSGLQILFSDGSVLTVGENSHVRVSEYTFDPATDDGHLTVEIPEGHYKMVTGRIAEKTPRKVSLIVPHGRVELLGTVVAGDSDEDGDSTVALLGPGAQRQSADKKGSFAFIPKGAALQTGENEIMVFKAGYAVVVDQEGNVSDPFEMSGRDFGQMVAMVARMRGDGEYEDGDVDEDVDLEEGDDGIEGEDELAEGSDDEDESGTELTENSEQDDDELLEDERGDLVALRESQEVTELADLEDIAGLKGQFVETGIEMENGGTFDYRFEFGTAESGKLDYIGFENVETADVTGGELSWDALVDDALPEDQTEIEFSYESSDGEEGEVEDPGLLTQKDGCVDACEGEIVVLNAGQGNIAKFHLVELETAEDSFEGKLVKPGGNNNFPGSE